MWHGGAHMLILAAFAGRRSIEVGTGEIQYCDLCGHARFDIVSERDRLGKPLTTVICKRCGLVTHSPLPSEEELAAYYARQYRREYHGEVQPSPRRVVRAWKNGQRIFRQLAPHLSGGERILEVGAGIGCTVMIFAQHGFAAAGIEPNEGFNRFTRERLGADVTGGSLFELPATPSYDLVLLIHVIEHFRSPTKALRHIYAMLNDGGRLYVECPNLAAPFATFPRLFHYAHVHNFTPDTLILLAQKCGFSVEKQFADEHDPNLQVLFRKAKPQEPEIPSSLAQKVLAAMHRYNLVTYHLRPRYLGARIAKLWGYLSEAVCAPFALPRLLKRGPRHDKVKTP